MKRLARDLSFVIVVAWLTIAPLNALSRAAYGHDCEPPWLPVVAAFASLFWTAHRLGKSRP